MKKINYLPLYKKWMKTGLTGYSGLCYYFEDSKYFELFIPNTDEKKFWYGTSLGLVYWGLDRVISDRVIIGDEIETQEFTPLRQNIVLFLAAMNGEL